MQVTHPSLHVMHRIFDEGFSIGNDAIDELELNAMSCDGSAARAKRRIGIPPKIATTG